MAKDTKPENGTFGIRLADGKQVEGCRTGEEIECFLNSHGRSIVPEHKTKGGKSKGARGRGHKTARQPRSER